MLPNSSDHETVSTWNKQLAASQLAVTAWPTLSHRRVWPEIQLNNCGPGAYFFPLTFEMWRIQSPDQTVIRLHLVFRALLLYNFTLLSSKVNCKNVTEIIFQSG